jgi:hypothetical protein
VTGQDFSKLELGYAATVDQLKDIKIESSLVLLPEAGHSRHDIAIQLTRATKDVSLFGEHAHYEQALDAGRSKGDFAKSLEAAKQGDPQEKSQSLADRYNQLINQQRMQREQSEQAQLSRQQSFQL